MENILTSLWLFVWRRQIHTHYVRLSALTNIATAKGCMFCTFLRFSGVAATYQQYQQYQHYAKHLREN